MDAQMWKRIAESRMIVTMANAKHIKNAWRRACYIIMRLQEMVMVTPRIYIHDNSSMDDIKMNVLLYTVIDMVNEIAQQHDCQVYHHDGIVYCGNRHIIDHIVKLGNQKED